MGYQFINIGADVIALSDYFNKLITGFKEIVKH